MTQIRLVLMLYFFMVVNKDACQTLLKAFLKSVKTVYEISGKAMYQSFSCTAGPGRWCKETEVLL